MPEGWPVASQPASTFFSNAKRYARALIRRERSVFGQRGRPASTHHREWSVFGQGALRHLGFCSTACPKLLQSRICSCRVECFWTGDLSPTGVLSEGLSENATVARGLGAWWRGTRSGSYGSSQLVGPLPDLAHERGELLEVADHGVGAGLAKDPLRAGAGILAGILVKRGVLVLGEAHDGAALHDAHG